MPIERNLVLLLYLQCMQTFLRKIRRSLIESRNVKKYILYAIGEIALVVVGILIALQINNWNEERKAAEVVKQYMENLLIDLAKDKSAVGPQYRIWSHTSYLQ